jgi:hypothetical protein
MGAPRRAPVASTSTPAESRWVLPLAASIGLLVVYLAVVAASLEVDYFDAFHAFTNGRTIWRGNGFYNPNRAPLFPAVYAGLAAVGARLGGGLWAFRAAHLLNVGFFALLLVVFHRLLRLSLSAPLAWAGTAALAGQGQLVHLAPMFKEDVFATLLATAAFYFYARSDQPGVRRGRNLMAAGAFLGLVGAAKYNLLPLLLVIVAAHELLAHRGDLKQPATAAGRVGALLVVPALVALAVVVAVYVAAGRATVLSAPASYLHDFREVFRTAQTEYKRDSALLAYRLLARALTPPLLACAVAGLVVSWRRPEARLPRLWLAVIFLVHAHWVAHKEVRYLLPALPPLCYFVAVGGGAAVGWVRQRAGLVAGVVVGLALAAWPVASLLRECRRFADPVYTVPFERQVSEAAAALAGPHRLYWIGRYYPVHPRDHVFDPADITTSIYHFGAHVVDYYTGKPVQNALTVGSPRAAAALLALPQSFGVLEDGDAFIFNPERDEYQTATVPERLEPLSVMRLRQLRLPVDEAGTVAAAGPPAAVQLRREGAQYQLRGQGLNAASVVVRLELATAVPLVAGVPVSGGSFASPVPAPPPGDRFTAITLRWYEPARQFSLPGSR